MEFATQSVVIFHVGMIIMTADGVHKAASGKCKVMVYASRSATYINVIMITMIVLVIPVLLDVQMINSTTKSVTLSAIMRIATMIMKAVCAILDAGSQLEAYQPVSLLVILKAATGMMTNV